MTIAAFQKIVLGSNLTGTDNGDGSITIDAAGSGIPTDGWISATTWTYASASTFTVSGDLTAVYTKGKRLKWTQTTVKYGVVAGSTHAAGTTTVTIIVNTDYVLANAAISANYYSPAEAPDGYPGWFSYACAATGFSGTPTTSARFQILNGWCYFEVTIDGTSNSTSFGFSLPVAAVQGGPPIGGLVYDNNATQAAEGYFLLQSASTSAAMRKTITGATTAWTASAGKGAYILGHYPF